MALINLKNIRISGLSVFLGLIILSYGNASAITHQSQIGSSGAANGKFSFPQGIALDSSGNIYVLDGGKRNVQKFNSAGVYQSKFGSVGSGDSQFDYPFDIALDSSDNIYVVDGNNARIQKFNSTGAYQSQFGSSGSGNGQFNSPLGISLDLSRNIYVVDGNNYRIQVFSDNVNCLPPVSGDWTITSSCVLQSSATAPANVIVQNGAILSIPAGKTLDVNFGANYLLVEQGGSLVVKSGGVIN